MYGLRVCRCVLEPRGWPLLHYNTTIGSTNARPINCVPPPPSVLPPPLCPGILDGVPVIQCLVNSPRARQASGGWLPQWKHGGTLLFCLSSAQIMYAFVMRPETLPKSYFDFIVKTGPISGPVVEVSMTVLCSVSLQYRIVLQCSVVLQYSVVVSCVIAPLACAPTCFGFTRPGPCPGSWSR